MTGRHAHVRTRPRLRHLHRRARTGRLGRNAALLAAGALAVSASVFSPSTGLPAEALTNPSYGALQTLSVKAAHVAETPRDGIQAARLGQDGSRLVGGGSWAGDVRWPFPFAVQASSSFGPRAAPCRGCSTNHKGLDLVPGRGVPIASIAAGRVVEAEYDASFGYHVVIEHTIDGRVMRSLSAHMTAGSFEVSAGQQVVAGQTIGRVGSTGQVTGPHLHLEIAEGGRQIDPAAFLRARAG